ncbi:MAG: hypothetical protein J6U04_01255 [Salinivirgaceae bacterium]|nr:hypothetical protein [Salinivirgaceae bacterium]
MSQTIQTNDNNIANPLILSEDEMAAHSDNLKKLSEKPLCELNLDEHPNLLVFPPDLKTHGDDIGRERIFGIDGNKLLTGNIMGFVGYRNTQVRISSRFANGDNDYFLHYMLRKVFAINLFDLRFDSDSESIFDFLLYLFPAFLKRAMRQGIYKEYQTRNYNNANIRGRIDVSRHIRQNIPFNGCVAYTTREYAIDNHLTQLIRHTIEYIAKHSYGNGILQNDDDVKTAVAQMVAATPTYNRNDRQKIVYQNLRPVSQPYFYEYRPLQRLCLQILRHEELKYGADDNQIYGILFDGAWLWEEYLNTILEGLHFEHPQNKMGKGRKYLFTDSSGVCYPDFYNSTMVLDAKYKGYSDWSKVQNADLFQVISYMHTLDLEQGGFVVPQAIDSSLPPKTLNGKSGTMRLYGVKVQHEGDFKGYAEAMREEEERIKAVINLEFAPKSVAIC